MKGLKQKVKNNLIHLKTIFPPSSLSKIDRHHVTSNIRPYKINRTKIIEKNNKSQISPFCHKRNNTGFIPYAFPVISKFFISVKGICCFHFLRYLE